MCILCEVFDTYSPQIFLWTARASRVRLLMGQCFLPTGILLQMARAWERKGVSRPFCCILLCAGSRGIPHPEGIRQNKNKDLLIIWFKPCLECNWAKLSKWMNVCLTTPQHKNRDRPLGVRKMVNAWNGYIENFPRQNICLLVDYVFWIVCFVAFFVL